MQPRVALLLGNGKYALHLQTHLRPSVAATTIALFPHGDTAVTNADHCVELLSPTRVLNYLQQEEIKQVIFGGNFDLAQMWSKWQSNPLQSLRSTADPHFYGIMFSLLRKRPGAALEGFQKVLRAHGYEPVAASNYLPDLKPGAGLTISAGTMATRPARDLDVLATRMVELANRELLLHPWPNARQAHLFDEDNVVLRETLGTDALLAAAQHHRKSAAPRTLVKLCPPDFDYRTDPPVVGPKTFELAAAAGVDLVVLDADKGILFDRERVSEICREHGITVCGYRSNEVSVALPRVPAA